MAQTKELQEKWNGIHIQGTGLVSLRPAAGLVDKFVHEYDSDEERYMYDSKGEPIGKEVQVMQNPLLGTQETFIPFFNNRSELMIDASDFYRIGKHDVNGNLLGSIRKDLRDYALVTSTSALGKTNSQYGRIVHNKGSTITEPTEKQTVIPHLKGASLAEVLNTDEGLAFCRALFNVEDDAENIATILERLTEYKRKNIVLFTPNQNNRNKEFTIRFSYANCSEEREIYGDKFIVGDFMTALDWYSGGRISGGTSRGIKPHKQ